MKRRVFISLLGGAAAAWPLAARARQGERMRRIGVLSTFAGNDPVYHGSVAGFRDGLAKLGWIEGRNLRIDYGGTGDEASKLPAHAAELVASTPDAILAIGPSRLAALQRATRIVPIVFVSIGDPIANGFVASLARPGGNITGFAGAEGAIAAKRLELLKQLAPGVTCVVVIYDPSNKRSMSGQLAEIETAAPSLGVKVSAAPIRNVTEIEDAIDALAREPNGGLIVLASPAVIVDRDKIIALAARYALPVVYTFRYFVAEGGLASYGVNDVDHLRGAASYVDRILKGEKPGDLPVQFATKFELVINLKTAKMLGLDPSISLLARTDEVIE